MKHNLLNHFFSLEVPGNNSCAVIGHDDFFIELKATKVTIYITDRVFKRISKNLREKIVGNFWYEKYSVKIMLHVPIEESID